MTNLRFVGLSALSKFLIVASLTFLPLVSLILAVILYISAPVFDTLENVVNQTVDQMMPLHELQNTLYQAAMPPNDFIIHGGSAQEKQAFKDIAMQVDEAFDQVATAYLAQPEFLPHIERAQRDWQAAKAAGLALLNRNLTLTSRDDAEAMERFDALIDATALTLNDLHLIAHKQIKSKQAEVAGLKEKGLFLSIAAVILAIVLGAGASLFLARQHERFQRQAQHDPLTGLFTREAFGNLLGQATQHTITYQKPGFALLLLDVDDFKRLNTEHGSRIGDEALLAFTETARRLLRSSDVVARQGGDRFMILLADSSKRNAMELAERMRATLEAEAFIIEGENIRLTASIGVAVFPDDADSPDKLIKLAEQNLALAKQDGRNCIRGTTYKPA